MASTDAPSYPLTVVYCPNCSMPPEYCEYGPKFAACQPWLRENFPHLYPHLFAPKPSEGTHTHTHTDAGADAAGHSAGEAGGAAGAASASAGSAAAAAGVEGVAAGVAKMSVSADAAAGAAGDSDGEGAEGGKKSRRGGQVHRGGPKPKKAASTGVIIAKKDRGRGKYVTSINGLEGFDIKLKEAASALGKRFGAGASVTKTATGGQQIEIQGDLTFDLPEVLEALFHIPEEAIVVKD